MISSSSLSPPHFEHHDPAPPFYLNNPNLNPHHQCPAQLPKRVHSTSSNSPVPSKTSSSQPVVVRDMFHYESRDHGQRQCPARRVQWRLPMMQRRWYIGGRSLAVPEPWRARWRRSRRLGIRSGMNLAGRYWAFRWLAKKNWPSSIRQNRFEDLGLFPVFPTLRIVSCRLIIIHPALNHAFIAYLQTPVIVNLTCITRYPRLPIIAFLAFMDVQW